MWRIVTPSLLCIILIATWVGYKPMQYAGYTYPLWANVAGWMVSMVSVAAIPTVMIIKIITTSGSFSERMHTLLTPTSAWGPKLSQDKLAAVEEWEVKGYSVKATELTGTWHKGNLMKITQ